MPRLLVPAVVFTLVFTVVIPGGVGVVTADDVTLEITVVDRNGIERGDVDISVTWNGSEGGPVNETTRANGKALVDVPDGADVSIAVVGDNYVRNKPFRISSVSSESIRVPASAAGRATVVVEGEDGPVPDATVDILSPTGRVDRQTTNESGVARTRLLEQDDYTVRVTAPGHLQRETSIEITNVEKTETIEVQQGDVNATVTVVDDHFEDPRPIADARVSVEGADITTTTGDDGTGTMSVPVNSRLQLTVSKEGYETGRTTLRTDEEPTSVEVAIQRESSVSIEAINRRVVVGESTVVTVTDEYDRPVEGATVSVGDESVGQTDTQGQVRVPIEDAGNVTIEAVSGDSTATVTVEGVDPDAETGTATPGATGTDPGTPTTTPGGDGPGFGVVVAILALLGAGLLGRRA